MTPTGTKGSLRAGTKGRRHEPGLIASLVPARNQTGTNALGERYVTFRVVSFSYKKLFHRRSYAKVTAILSKHSGFFCKKIQNSSLLIFVTIRTHNT